MLASLSAFFYYCVPLNLVPISMNAQHQGIFFLAISFYYRADLVFSYINFFFIKEGGGLIFEGGLILGNYGSA